MVKKMSDMTATELEHWMEMEAQGWLLLYSPGTYLTPAGTMIRLGWIDKTHVLLDAVEVGESDIKKEG